MAAYGTRRSLNPTSKGLGIINDTAPADIVICGRPRLASVFSDALNGGLRSCWNGRPRFPWLPNGRNISGDRNDGDGLCK
jgi:hypothetical protein